MTNPVTSALVDGPTQLESTNVQVTYRVRFLPRFRCCRWNLMAGGMYKPVSATRVRPKREKPFAAEYALLAELGLGRK